MWRRYALALALASVAGSGFAAAPACAPHSRARDERGLRALETEWLFAKDRATLDRILADDFEHPVFTGDVLKKRQHIEWTLAHPRPGDRHPKFGALEVRVFGTTALATGSVAVTGDKGQVLSRNLFTDVFLYRRCRWQAVSAQETAVETPEAGASPSRNHPQP